MVLSGVLGDYTFIGIDGTILVGDNTAGRDGLDSLVNVEKLTFMGSGQTLDVSALNLPSLLDYIASYPDLVAAYGANEQAGANHYVTYGYAEGRTVSFNGLQYIAAYADLMASLGTDEAAGAQHYIQTGRNEIAQGTRASSVQLTTVTLPNGQTRNQTFMLARSIQMGTAGNDTLTGTTGNDGLFALDGNDSLVGGAGNDGLSGGAGDDSLVGGAGQDQMAGGTGNDLYDVDDAGDVVVERSGEGTDAVQASVSYTLTPNVENLTLTGANPINGVGNTLANVITGNTGANVLDGGDGDDTLQGGNGNDTLTGGNGNDWLEGGSGADSMTGGQGDDTFVVDSTSDTVTETTGQGTDTVLSSVSRILEVNVEKLVLTGTNAINGTANSTGSFLTGNSGANILTGDIGNDTFASGAGNDTMNGAGGNDKYAFLRGDGKDLVIDNGGNDKLTFALTGGTEGRINYDNLWFEQVGNNLGIRVMGSPTDAITIRDWYMGGANQVETIEAAAGSDGTSLKLLNTQVQQLVSAMAGMSPAASATSWAGLSTAQRGQLQGLGVWQA